MTKYNKKVTKINSEITLRALNKNKKQYMKRKKWIAKINETKIKKEKSKQKILVCLFIPKV